MPDASNQFNISSKTALLVSLPSMQCRGRDPFLTDLQTKMSYAISVTATRAPYPTQLILPNVVTLLFSEEYESRRHTLVLSIAQLRSTLNV